MEVGKKYRYSPLASPALAGSIYECVYRSNNMACMKLIPSGSLCITYNNSDWKEYKEPKKVYCSVWKYTPNNPSNYQWSISYNDFARYNAVKDAGLRSGFIMIKEWELEYEPS